MKLVDQRIYIDAPPARVYALLTEADLLIGWMAPTATVEPRVGGVISWTHASGDRVAGLFLELVPDRRVVFSYGWDRADVEMPPGSTTVEIDLRPQGAGTRLHLVHRGLTDPMADAHHGGWVNYLDRLATVAAGRDPGPDRLADQRVPAARPGRPSS